MRTHVYIPPLPKPTGGVYVLYELADVLLAAGCEVFLCPREGTAPPAYTGRVPLRPMATLDQDWTLGPGDLWLVPEGWVNALTPGLRAGARCLVYVQNWAYLFSSLPPDVAWDQLSVDFLAVSDPVARYIETTLGRDAPVLRPGIDLDLFTAPDRKPHGLVRVACMPRKNKALLAQITDAFTARRRLLGQDARAEVRFTPIDGVSRAEVADLLRQAHVFLATGFPEGCPLPPLEAMASGCLVTGFGGYGGWDYMRQAEGSAAWGDYAPWWPLRKAPWGGNGLFAADADVPAAALALAEAVRWWEEDDPRLRPTLDNARQTALVYSRQAFFENTAALWNSLTPKDRT